MPRSPGFLTAFRIVVGLGLLLSLFFYVGWQKLASHFAALDSYWLVASAAAILIAVLIGTLNLHLLISSGGEIAMHRFLPIYWVSWAFSLVVPGQVGDLFSLSVLLRRSGLSWHAIVGRTLVDKLLSLVVLGILAGFGLARWWHQLSWDMGYWPAIAMIAVLVGGLILLKAAAKTSRWIEIVAQTIATVGHEFSVTVRRYPLRVATNFTLTWLKVIFTGIAYWAMFKSLGAPQLQLLDVLLLMAASSLVAYLPVSFNGLGTVELTGILLFASLGVPEDTVFSAYLGLRVLVLGLAWGPTALWLLLRRYQQGGDTLSQGEPRS